MTKITLMYLITKEIKKLNSQIDRKIVKGQKYDRDARRHRELVHRLRRMESEASFARTLTYALF
ncbi:MAG: hypothetical protein RIQ72_142 [Candidatus Parcubacteria bacterium]|jgi:hypothetical protein